MIQNNFRFIGRLTKDATYFSARVYKPSLASFDLAVDRTKEDVDFVHLVAFGNTADFINNYVSKGTLVAVTGRVTFTSNVEINSEYGKSNIIVPEFIVDDIKILSKPQNKE